MKQVVFFFLLLLTTGAWAQTFNTSTTAGVLVGTNFSRLNFNKSSPVPPPPVPVTTYFEASVRAGFYTNVRFNKRISLRNEYIFSHVKNHVHTNNRQFSLNYVELPVLLAYDLNKRLSLQGGPALGFLISASEKTNNVTEDITHDTEERSIGLNVGAAYAVSSRLSFYARYQHGMNHIGIGQRSNVFEFKLEQLQFLLQVKM